MQHEAHMQDTNDAAVPQDQIKKGTGHVEEIFLDMSPVEHIRIFNT